jgi:hypothetical protein
VFVTQNRYRKGIVGDRGNKKIYAKWGKYSLHVEKLISLKGKRKAWRIPRLKI